MLQIFFWTSFALLNEYAYVKGSLNALSLWTNLWVQGNCLFTFSTFYLIKYELFNKYTKCIQSVDKRKLKNSMTSMLYFNMSVMYIFSLFLFSPLCTTLYIHYTPIINFLLFVWWRDDSTNNKILLGIWCCI